jgi:hypothetical protein
MMLQRLIRMGNNSYVIHCLLVLFTFSFFAIHFGQVLKSPNSFLSVFSGDGIHGYYSYINHICNNKTFIATIGLNFPFGEHIVYTDAQPLLATIVSLIPFLKPYAIGVMHVVIFLSFVFVSNVYFKIFELYKVNRFLAFCSSIAIAILSPQIGRVGGHFALAYSLPIPLVIYFGLAYYKINNQKYIYYSSLVSTLAFFTHPYLGLGTTLFSLLFFLISKTFPLKQINLRYFLNSLFLVVPVVLFKFTMKLTDRHFQRPVIPYGETVYVSSPDLVFLPHFGPLQNLFNNTDFMTPEKWEGVSYVGLACSIFLSISLIVLIFKFSKKNLPIIFLLMVSTFFLLFSFGYVNNLLKDLGIYPTALKQFRGLGRFAWYFYYCTPVFIIVIIDDFIKKVKSNLIFKNILVIVLGLVYLFGNSYEGYYFHKNLGEYLFQDKNYFKRENITSSQNKIIQTSLSKSYQAILPLPYFHLGSEVYHRPLEEIASMAMLLSFHSKLPILSHLGSRTSLYETEKGTGSLNSFRSKPELKKLMSDKPILIIYQGNQLKPEEERLLQKSKFVAKIDELNLFELQAKDLLNPEVTPLEKAVNLTRDTVTNKIYKVTRSQPPFYQWYKCYEYNKLFILDSNKMESGNYIVTFYFHFKKFNLENTRAHFIVEGTKGNSANWDFFGDIHFSQRYPSYFVYEQKVKLQKDKKYIFFINHEVSNGDYYVSNFCLRPDTLDYYEKRNGEIIRINNYPIGY